MVHMRKLIKSVCNNCRHLFPAFLLIQAVTIGQSLSAQSPGTPPFQNTLIKSIARVNATQHQSDGKLIVAGEIDYFGVSRIGNLVRLLPNGNRDDTFITGAGTNGRIDALAIQQDGKILIGGGFNSYNGSFTRNLARLHADGRLDGSFMDFPTSIITVNSEVRSIAIQPDGKILIGGNFTSIQGQPRQRIARLLPNGVLDESFNVPDGCNNSVRSIMLQSDGKIIIGGDFNIVGNTPKNKIARLNPNGQIDATFNMGTGFQGGVSFVETMEPAADGKFYVGGIFAGYNGTNYRNIIRLNADGSVDLAFNTTFSTGGQVSAIAVQPDGKVWAGGVFTSFSGFSTGKLVRINPDGSRDISASIPYIDNGNVNAVALQEDGRIIVSGYFRTVGTGNLPSHLRLLPNGQIDISYPVSLGSRADIKTMSELQDGRLLIAGNISRVGNQFVRNVALLNSDGTPSDNGIFSQGANSFVNASITTADGGIILGGDLTEFNGVNSPKIVKIRPDGNVVSDFIVETIKGGLVNKMLRHPNGGILVQTLSNVYMINEDGSPVPTYVVGSGASNLGIKDVALDKSGRILVAGNFTSYNGIPRNNVVRIFPDGTVDETFDAGSGTIFMISKVLPLPDGDVLVGGGFSSFSGVFCSNVIRLDTNGKIKEGKCTTSYTGVVTAMNMIGDTYFLLAAADTKLQRFGVDGYMDESLEFQIDGPQSYTSLNSETVQSILHLRSGNILLGGNFSNVNGNLRYGLHVIADQFNPFVNAIPTLDQPSEISFLHTAGEQVIVLTGISDGNNGIQNIQVTAEVDNSILIPFVQVEYISPQATGIVRIRNDRNMVGSTNLRITVVDNGGTANGGVDRITRTIGVNVLLDTDIEEEVTQLPSDFSIQPNFPNPFNPTTTLRVELPQASDVEVTVYDLTGRVVMQLPARSLQAGRHSITLDASSLGSGVYVYRVSTGTWIASGKMTLVK